MNKEYFFSDRDLMKLMLPLVIEQFLALLVGIIDSIMIANVGEAAVSGVSLVDNLMILFINLSAALAMGGAVITGQYLGHGESEEADKAASQLIWSMIISFSAITVAFYIGRNVLMTAFFGTIEADVLKSATVYYKIVSFSIPFLAVYNAAAAIFRTVGNSRISMLISIGMNIINVSGNAILIYGFHCGTEGVAIPTFASRVFAAVSILCCLYHDNKEIHVTPLFSIHPDIIMIRRIFRIGIPNGIENSMIQFGKIVILSLVSTFGTSSITANAVGNSFALFQVLPGLSINMAITTVISRCVGAGDYKQVKYYHRKILFIIYGVTIFINLVMYVLSPSILDVYHLSEETRQITWAIIIFHSVSCVLLWPAAFSVATTLRAAGDVKYPMVISSLSLWIVRIGGSYIIGKFMGMGIFGVWVAMIIDWSVRAVFCNVRYYQGKWCNLCAI